MGCFFGDEVFFLGRREGERGVLVGEEGEEGLGRGEGVFLGRGVFFGVVGG